MSNFVELSSKLFNFVEIDLKQLTIYNNEGVKS